jgi:hypothetical protein
MRGRTGPKGVSRKMLNAMMKSKEVFSRGSASLLPNPATAWSGDAWSTVATGPTKLKGKKKERKGEQPRGGGDTTSRGQKLHREGPDTDHLALRPGTDSPFAGLAFQIRPARPRGGWCHRSGGQGEREEARETRTRSQHRCVVLQNEREAEVHDQDAMIDAAEN